MFINVKKLKVGVPCNITGFGHTEVSDDPKRFQVVNQEEFIKEIMSDQGRYNLFGHGPPWSGQEIKEKALKCIKQTSINTRMFFSGNTAELGVIAAKKCLEHANVKPNELGAIIGATNTGPGYPSVADHVKLWIGGHSNAMCYDAYEACTVGSIVVFLGWNLIHSGICDKVLVVVAEKATSLAPYDDWLASNLFGDASFAFLLQKSQKEAFIFFDIDSLPYDGNLGFIVKTEEGFNQNGPQVHRFVGNIVVKSLVKAVGYAGLGPNTIDHLVSHQPSGKTLDLLEAKLRKRWTGFNGVFHRNVEIAGNTSGASTGLLISQGVHNGLIKKDQIAVVTTFGSGLSIGNYAVII